MLTLFKICFKDHTGNIYKALEYFQAHPDVTHVYLDYQTLFVVGNINNIQQDLQWSIDYCIVLGDLYRDNKIVVK